MLPTNFVITNTQIIIYEMRIVLENNIIKDIIKTLSQFGEVNYRMTTDGAEFYTGLVEEHPKVSFYFLFPSIPVF
jgi:hypothetical protein